MKGHWATKGLIGLWLLNEGDGNIVRDLSGSNSIGVLMGTSYWTAGRFGSAIDFDGDSDYISLGTPVALNVGYITVSCWARLDDPTGNQYDVFYARANSENGTVLFQKTDNAGAQKIYFQVKLAASPTTARTAISDAAATAGWHHYVGTYDGDKVKLYIDGVLQGTTNDTDGVIDTASWDSATYFAVHTSGTSYLEGQIDNAAIWDWALTQSQVNIIYRDPFCMFERDPIEIWTGAAASGAAAGGNAPTGNIWGPLGGSLRGVA